MSKVVEKLIANLGYLRKLSSMGISTMRAAILDVCKFDAKESDSIVNEIAKKGKALEREKTLESYT
eukprot:784070-Amphidinium_carterae.1